MLETLYNTKVYDQIKSIQGASTIRANKWQDQDNNRPLSYAVTFLDNLHSSFGYKNSLI